MYKSKVNGVTVMKTHAQRARELFEQGYNCAQAVFAAFCDETGMDMETALKISAPFGGGIGRLREVCGAVSGMAMAAGMKYGYTDPQDMDTKMAHYSLIQSLANAFKEANGSFICRELLNLDGAGNPIPEARTPQYYQARPCADLVERAAGILEEYMQSK